jgi:hypothetical protein
MSRTPHEAINVSNPGFVTGTLPPMTLSSPFSPNPATVPIGDYQYPPESAQNQGPHGLSNFVDGSGPIFSMYLEMASEEDKKNAENWKADADGILIFVRLCPPIPLFIHADSSVHRLVYSPRRSHP